MELIQTNEVLKKDQRRQALDISLLNIKAEEYKKNYEEAVDKYSTFNVI